MYLEQRNTLRDKSDYYFAQIAAEVRKSVLSSADSMKVEVDDFLLRFKDSDEEEELDLQEEIRRRKAIWFSALGITAKP